MKTKLFHRPKFPNHKHPSIPPLNIDYWMELSDIERESIAFPFARTGKGSNFQSPKRSKYTAPASKATSIEPKRRIRQIKNQADSQKKTVSIRRLLTR